MFWYAAIVAIQRHIRNSMFIVKSECDLIFMTTTNLVTMMTSRHGNIFRINDPFVRRNPQSPIHFLQNLAVMQSFYVFFVVWTTKQIVKWWTKWDVHAISCCDDMSFDTILPTLDISQLYMIRWCTKNNDYNYKTSVRFALMNDNPYLDLTGELWVVFRELYSENDRDISRAHCITSCVIINNTSNFPTDIASNQPCVMPFVKHSKCW